MQVASGVTIRPELAMSVSEYGKNLDSQFMATKVLPLAPTALQSSTFGKLPIENITDEAGNLERAPGTPYATKQSKVENDNYTCRDRGLTEAVDDGEAKRMANYVNAEQAAANTCMFHMLRAREVRAATLLFNATNFAGHTGDVSTEWSNVASTPYNDIQDLILTIKQAVGGAYIGSLELSVSEKVFRNIVQTTQIQGKIMGGSGSSKDKKSGPTMIDAKRLADILGIDAVNYSCAQNKTAGTLADIWDDEYALLSIQNRSDNLSESVQLGRTFYWTEDCPDNALVETYRSDDKRSNIVRVREYSIEKVFNYAAGYLLSNITA